MTGNCNPAVPNDLTVLVHRASEFAFQLGDEELTSYHVLRSALECFPCQALESLRAAGYALPALRCDRSPRSAQTCPRRGASSVVDVGPGLRAALCRLVLHGPACLPSFLDAALAAPCARLRDYLAAIGARGPSGDSVAGYSGMRAYLESAAAAVGARRGVMEVIDGDEEELRRRIAVHAAGFGVHAARARLSEQVLPVGLSTENITEEVRILRDELLTACLGLDGGPLGSTVAVERLVDWVGLDRAHRYDLVVLRQLDELSSRGWIDAFDAGARCDAVRLGGAVRLSSVAEREVLTALESAPLDESDRAALKRRLG